MYTVRDDEAGRPALKRASSHLFYRVMNNLSDIDLEAGAADFRLLGRPVVDVLNGFWFDPRQFERREFGASVFPAAAAAESSARFDASASVKPGRSGLTVLDARARFAGLCAMLAILATLLVWLPALVGLGAVIPYGGDPSLRRAISGLQGFGVLGVAAAAVHFFLPIGPAVSATLWAAGVALFIIRLRWLREGANVAEFAGILCAPPLLLRWMQAPELMFDSGLYYLQSIAWVTDRPLVLGLGNLHTRLAYNSFLYPVSGALELPLLHGRSSFFVGLLPLAFAAGCAGVGLWRMVRARAAFSDLILALSFTVIWHCTAGLGAASSDQAAEVFVVLGLAATVRALEAPPATFEAELRAPALLSVLAMMLKSSALLVLLGPLLALALRRNEVTRRWLWTTAGLAAVALLAWALNSFLLSGCLVYPVASSCVSSLPWAIPGGEVHQESTIITAWARLPNRPVEDAAGWGWIGDWAARMVRRMDIRLLGASVGIGLAAWLAALRRTTRLILVPFAVALAGAGFVFLAAPDPRFGFGFLHAVWLLPLGFALSQLPRRFARFICPLAVLALVPASQAWARSGHYWTSWRLDSVAFPSLPAQRVEEHLGPGGLRVHVPAAGDQRCWAAPLPCTPWVNPDLQGGSRWFGRSRQGVR